MSPRDEVCWETLLGRPEQYQTSEHSNTDGEGAPEISPPAEVLLTTNTCWGSRVSFHRCGPW